MQPTQIQQTHQSVASNQNHIKQEPIHQKPSNLVTAQRVAEILKAAGETFCRLGECTMMLDQSANPNKTKVTFRFEVYESHVRTNRNSYGI